MFYSQNRELDSRLAAIHDIMFSSPGYFYIKDAQGHLLYVNQSLLLAAGYTDINDMLGTTDFNTPWGEHAAGYQQIDQQVMKFMSAFKNRELIESSQKEVYPLATHKKSFYHNDKLVGVCGISVEVPTHTLNQNQPFTESTEFIDMHRHKKLSLTRKQKKILHWVLKGLSSKEVANNICLSHRTVEHHISGIKYLNQYSSLKDILLNVYPI
jgi:hypothetical protein